MNKNCFITEDNLKETPSLGKQKSQNAYLDTVEEEAEKSKNFPMVNATDFKKDNISFQDKTNDVTEYRREDNDDAKELYFKTPKQNINYKEMTKAALDNNLSPIVKKQDDTYSIQTNILLKEEKIKEKELLINNKFDLMSNNEKSINLKQNKDLNKENNRVTNPSLNDMSTKKINKLPSIQINLLTKEKVFPMSNKIIYIEFSNGIQYYGNFNSKKNPSGIGKFINHNLEYKGEFTDSEVYGFGIYSINGSIITTSKANDKIYSKEEWIDKSSFEGIYFNDNKSIGRYKWADGTTYEGEIENLNLNGYGIMTFSDGKIYKGYWKNGAMNGYSEQLLTQNKKYIGFCKDDKKDGFGIFDWGSQKIFVGFWLKNKQHGIGKLINHKSAKYGVWSGGERLSWFTTEKDALAQLGSEDVVYRGIFTMEYDDLIKYISK